MGTVVVHKYNHLNIHLLMKIAKTLLCDHFKYPITLYHMVMLMIQNSFQTKVHLKQTKNYKCLLLKHKDNNGPGNKLVSLGEI